MKSNDLDKETLGLMPPHNLELEKSLLGCILIDSNCIINVVDIIFPESFYNEINFEIYKTIQKMFINSLPIDLVSVYTELRKNPNPSSIVDVVYLSELTALVSNTVNAEHYARKLAEYHIRRTVISSSSIAIKNAYDESIDTFDLVASAENQLVEITESYTGKQFNSMRELTMEAILEIENAKHNTTGITGVPSGLPEIDTLTSGWQRNDLIIIAARPAMGKTAFVLSIAKNAALKYDKPVAIFSLEMSSVQLVKRMISSETSVPAEKMRNGQISDFEFSQIHERIHDLSQAPIYIDDTPAITPLILRAKAKRLKKQHDIQLIVVDYLQLMSSGRDSNFREQEIAQISRSLKDLAKELNVPVIALSQLSRSVETRGGDKRPVLSDLRESGSIEQDADLVCFLHRPEYYGHYADESGESLLGRAEFIIAKHRSGACATATIKYVNQYTRFESLLPEVGDFSTNLEPNLDF